MDTLPSGIRFRHWPIDHAKAYVLLAHGLAEHTGRYEEVAKKFNAQSIAVVGPDHVGHGLSSGRRGHVDRFREYLLPLSKLRGEIAKWSPGLPVFLLGHSLGGLIVAHLLLEDPLQYQGALFSGPAFSSNELPTTSFMLLARLLRSVAPKLGVKALDAKQISRDPSVVEDYITDPLVYSGRFSISLMIEILHAMGLVIERAHEIDVPIYIAHGASDTMANPEGSEAFYTRLSSKDKTLKIWPDLFHEIFQERQSELVIEHFVEWVGAHV